MSQNICIREKADVQQIKRCKSLLKENRKRLNLLSEILVLAGNEVRLQIIFLLMEEGELCVCDLSDILKMNISAISQHLRKLKDGKVVNIRKAGQTYYYSINRRHPLLMESLIQIINQKSQS